VLTSTFSNRIRPKVAAVSAVSYSDVNLYVGSRSNSELVYDSFAINQSILSIFGTTKGTRIFRPEFGTSVDDLLFEPMCLDVAERIRDFVKSEINTWEPRVELTFLQVNSNVAEQHYQIIMEYRVIGVANLVNFSFLLSQTTQ